MHEHIKKYSKAIAKHDITPPQNNIVYYDAREEHRTLRCTITDFPIYINQIASCLLTFNSLGFTICWDSDSTNIAREILYGELDEGSLVWHDKKLMYRNDKIALSGEAYIYVHQQKLGSRKHIALYTHHSQLNDIVFHREILSYSLINIFVHLTISAILLKLLLILFKIVICLYLVQLCMCLIYILYIICYKDNAEIDYVEINNNYGILMTIVEYAIVRAHNINRAAFYIGYSDKKISYDGILFSLMKFGKYVVSGIGKSGWDIIESGGYCIGVDYTVYHILFRDQMRKRSSVIKNIRLYFTKGRGYTNPERLKKLFIHYGHKKITMLHDALSGIYSEHSRQVVRAMTSHKGSRDHLCYIDSSGCGITFTHAAGDHFRRSEDNTRWISYIKIKDMEIQIVSNQRADLMNAYSEEYVRMEILRSHINALEISRYPLIISSIDKTKILWVSDVGSLGYGTGKSIQCVAAILSDKKGNFIDQSDVIYIMKFNNDQIKDIIMESYINT